MKIGFTGTRKGMSELQKISLRALLAKATLEPSEFHHGDCIGADAEADWIARSMGITIVVHPPTDPTYRAFCYRIGDGLWSTDSYLNRNANIVDATDMLIAAPQSDDEELRSGTWSTVRYARGKGKSIQVIPR